MKFMMGKSGPQSGKPLFDPSAGISGITERYIYSTGVLGPGAKGEMRLFTVPRGQTTPTLGSCKGVIQTEAHTNIVKAGELGPAFGEAAFNGIRVYTQDLAIGGVDARLQIVVAGRIQFETPLASLLGKTDFRPFKVSVLAARTDTIEARLAFDKELTEADIPSGIALIRVELSGGFIADTRG